MPFDEFFDFRFGPFGSGFWGIRPFKMKYARTKDSHILRIRLSGEPKKEEIRVRWLKEGVLEIEWPKREEGEEIEIE